MSQSPSEEKIAQLEADNARLRGMLDALPVLIAYVDQQQRYRYVNAQYQYWFGLSPEQIVGRTIREVVGEAAYGQFQGEISRVLAGERYHWERELPFEQGSRYVHTEYVPDRDGSGQVLGYYAMVWDMTERQRNEQALFEARQAAEERAAQLERAEQELREVAERFRTLADNIAQLAWMADSSGWIFWYNRRWFEFTGTALEEMEGWGWRVVHHPDHLQRVVDKFSHCIHNGQVWEDTFPLRGRDGQYRWFLSRAIPIRDQAGQVLRWFGTNTDITERMEMEEVLRQTDRRKDEFLATLAHELRNPLAPITTGLELLKLAGNDPQVAGEAQRIMERQVRQLTRLVDDLLDVSRITRGKVNLLCRQVGLREVLDSAFETARPLIDARQQTLQTVLPRAPVILQADPARLAQVFANLLQNAAQYSPPGSQLQLMADIEDGQVVVRVIDPGDGIPLDQLESVFELFHQVNNLLERKQGGLGIGLTLVRSLVELHGGRVRAFSRGPGQGSEFTVWLPLAQVAAGDPPGLTPSHPADGSRRVLVVDDNTDAADSLSQLLTAMGQQVRTAYGGREALAAAADFQPQVVVLDIGMPDINGYEVARRLRREPWGRQFTLIALTGWGQEEDRRRSREAGFDHHLVKPVEVAALQNLMKTP